MSVIALPVIGCPKVVPPPRGMWTKEEDELLTQWVTQLGARKWKSIAEHIPGRNGKQCRERWMSHISPDLKNPEWTDEEDQELEKLHAAYGNKWSKLTAFFPGRPPNAIKNRWNCILRKTKRESKESPCISPIATKAFEPCANVCQMSKKDEKDEFFDNLTLDFSFAPDFENGFENNLFGWDN